jgi:biopolymer transport protein ExbD
MSEILQKEHRNKAGVHKRKKSSLRVDLTPMVDLGFLLISFFVFTTSIAHPTAMTLKVPADSKDSSKAPENKTLSLILAADNVIYAYNGNEINNLRDLGNSPAALRSAILQKKIIIKTYYGSDSDMVVLIKPTPDATYANVINALDEMQICAIKTYVLMDTDKNELQKLK